ncbi:MAG TPA: hypothetical protein VLM91_04410, partial [Candidatus Methylomirabilis sp.]|nr:hypothetical protein [Candidatus Methylomirabilis sp.]
RQLGVRCADFIQAQTIRNAALNDAHRDSRSPDARITVMDFWINNYAVFPVSSRHRPVPC